MDLIRRYSEWTRRNLHAETVESTLLATPSAEGVYALRSLAYCKTAGLEIGVSARTSRIHREVW